MRREFVWATISDTTCKAGCHLSNDYPATHAQTFSFFAGNNLTKNHSSSSFHSWIFLSEGVPSGLPTSNSYSKQDLRLSHKNILQSIYHLPFALELFETACLSSTLYFHLFFNTLSSFDALEYTIHTRTFLLTIITNFPKQSVLSHWLKWPMNPPLSILKTCQFL